MLQYRTIDDEILELLKTLQTVPELHNMRLVGGTALALQIGHRKSVDIDLFGKLKVDKYKLSEILNSLGSIKTLQNSGSINIYLINNIKVDIVNYPYAWLNEPIETKNIKLAGLPDIAAMKFSAITGRGTKKDFIDLYFLLNRYSLTEIFSFYNNKFPDGSELLVLKSLLYFDDAEGDDMPIMFKNIEWPAIKSYIKAEVKNYIQSL